MARVQCIKGQTANDFVNPIIIDLVHSGGAARNCNTHHPDNKEIKSITGFRAKCCLVR